jgi:hypothetical protein
MISHVTLVPGDVVFSGRKVFGLLVSFFLDSDEANKLGTLHNKYT